MTLRSLLLAATAVTLLASPVAAQAFDPLAPPVATAAPAAPERIRALPADPTDLEFAGEYARRSFAVHLTDAEATSARELRIKVSDRAVSVLPETAGLFAFVNGRAVGAVAGPDLSSGADIRLSLPPALVVAGFNEVRLEARQEHRVDCSIESGYELWTRLDPSATGIVHGETQSVLRGSDGLTHVLQGNGAPGHLRLVLPGKTDDRLAASAVRAAQAVALAGRAWRPAVTVTGAPEPGPGTNIRFVGPGESPALVRAGGVELMTDIYAVPRQGEPAMRDIVLIGGSPSAIERLADVMAGSEGRTATGTREGLAALGASYGIPIAEEQPMPLSVFGIGGIDFGGRRLTEEVRVTLPADFFASGYSTVRLSLAGRYNAGLTPDSILRIRVNDAVAGAVPLSTIGGVWNGHVVQLPLSMFHSGANTIQFEALLTTEGDATCDPVAGGTSANRITLDPATSLTFPRLARVGNMPEIGATLVSGWPYTARQTPVPFWVADRDPRVLGAAATVAAQLAVAQGRPIPVAINFRAPVGADESGFVFAPTNLLPEWLQASLRDDPAFTTDRANAQIARTDRAAPKAVTAAPEVIGATLDTEAPPTPEDASSDPFRMLHEQILRLQNGELSEKSGDLLAGLGRTIHNLSNGIVNREILLPGPADLVVFQTADLPIGISVGDAIFRAGAVPNAWTVFTGETAQALAGGVQKVAEGQRWNQLSGRLTVVRDGSTRIDALPADQQVMTATRDFTISNARLALAGWFSRNTPFFAQMMIGACVLVGLFGWLYSRQSRTRT
jgi:hypothetical protein